MRPINISNRLVNSSIHFLFAQSFEDPQTTNFIHCALHAKTFPAQSVRRHDYLATFYLLSLILTPWFLYSEFVIGDTVLVCCDELYSFHVSITNFSDDENFAPLLPALYDVTLT